MAQKCRINDRYPGTGEVTLSHCFVDMLSPLMCHPPRSLKLLPHGSNPSDAKISQLRMPGLTAYFIIFEFISSI